MLTSPVAEGATAPEGSLVAARAVLWRHRATWQGSMMAVMVNVTVNSYWDG